MYKKTWTLLIIPANEYAMSQFMNGKIDEKRREKQKMEKYYTTDLFHQT